LGYRAEQPFRGFEEGLAEGIAGLVSRWAAFIPGVPAYGRYVQAHDVLADRLGVTSEAIYRRLYRFANGAVMDAFVTEIDALRVAAGALPFTVEQRGRLGRAARRLFDIAYQQEPASPRARRAIREAWQRALQ
jgi:hypothetical protein